MHASDISEAYLPAAHLVQLLAAAEEELPAGQALHSDADSLEYSPAVQGLHAADRALEKWPAAHSVQLFAAADEALPAGQMLHSAEEAKE